MIHTITITKKDFINNDYTYNFSCPLATALKRHFPNATYIFVGVYQFEILIPGIGYLHIDFNKCDILSPIDHNHIHIMDEQDVLGDAILISSLSTGRLAEDNIQDLTFSFKTA